MDSASFGIRWVQGINTKNIAFIDNKTICYPCGNYIIFFDTESKTQSVLQCISGSVGAFAVDQSGGELAFSDQRLYPVIYVYSFPGLLKSAELRGGVQLDYTLLAFSSSGPYLASYSSIPDYTLTIWNWKEGTNLCSKSERNEEMTGLSFNPMNWHQLCLASGTFLSVWTVERCDTVYQLKSTSIKLPLAVGSVMKEEAIFGKYTSTGPSYYGPELHVSAIAGLVGDAAETFVPQDEKEPLVHPVFHCWSSTSDLYVGCEEGHLLVINTEICQVYGHFSCETINRLNEDSKADSFQNGSINTMALNKEGLYAAGHDGMLRCFHIKNYNIRMEECWDATEPIESIAFSTDYKDLLVATSKGSVYIYNPKELNHPSNVLSINNDHFLFVDLLFPENEHCVTVGISGGVQIWSLKDGAAVSSLIIGEEATSLVCFPSSHCAAVGTSLGHVYFIDLSEIEDPQIVHRVLLYHLPLEHLHCDQEGHFLLTGAENGHIYILDIRPSRTFQVLGYTVVGGKILNFSTLFDMETKQITVMALVCQEEVKRKAGGTRLEIFTLPLQLLSDQTKHTDRKGLLHEDSILKHYYDLERPLSSAVLGTDTSTVFGYFSTIPFLCKYTVPQENVGVVLTSKMKVRGNQLGPGFLHISPHHKWLAALSRDGMLCLFDSSNLEKFAEIQCHSYRTGGIRSLAFSIDGQSILTTGTEDGALVCLKWNILDDRLKSSIEYAQSVASHLKNTIFREDVILDDMPSWNLSDLEETLVQGKETELSLETKSSLEVTEQDESYTKLSAVEATWLDQKQEEAIKEETEKFAQSRKKLKIEIKQLRTTIQSMMRENELLPDTEKLDQQEFNLDTEEQEKLQAESEQEVERVRKEIEMDNLAKRYLREVIKQECWDAMAVKGRAVKAFHSGYEVKNYPLKERTPKELHDIERALNLKKIENVDLKARKEIVEIQPVPIEEEEDVEEESSPKDSTALLGSLSSLYVEDVSNLYSQLDLHTKEQKINQIALLQDIIYKVKIAFNKEFQVVCRQKEQEISRVKERNTRIQEIISELHLKETVVEPTFSDNEKPEKALTVEDSEITVEKYLTPDQKKEAEESIRLQEQKRLAALGDNAKQRALNDMMGGVLEVKKEDILRMKISKPDFMAKSEDDWTDEEKKQNKEYEKKTKELIEEQEKYKKVLEAEMKKIQTSILESTQAFDDALSRLFDRKVKSEMVIYQEELKINNLVFSILVDEELNVREAQLNNILEKKRKQKMQSSDAVQNFKTQVDEFKECYDNLVAEDKLLERGFRKEFSDIPAHQVDILYKLYKRRPRVQRMRTQTDSTSPFGECPRSAKAYNDALIQLSKAMDELDSPEHMPEIIEPPIWERFCNSRRAKVDYEQQVKRKALTLAEMQAFLQKKTEEDDKLREDIETIMQELNGVREEKMKFQLDLTVQFLLKQGQVEIDTTYVIPEYSDAVLVHRSVIEDLNSIIRTLGEQKITSMVESKDFHKGIIQLEWEHKKLRMEMEDLHKKVRDIQMLRITRELQVFLNVSNYDSRIAHQMSVLEETLKIQEKHHKQDVKNRKKIIKELERHINQRIQINKQLDHDLEEMSVSVAERRYIYNIASSEQCKERNLKDRYQDILSRRKLVDIVKVQAHEVSILRAEVERLRMKTFPVLIQLNY